MNELIRISVMGQDSEATLVMMKILKEYLSNELLLRINFENEDMRVFSVSANAGELKLRVAA